MSKAIDHIRAKVTRAKQHIQDLKLALIAFRDSNPHRIAVEEETQRTNSVYDVVSPDGTRETRSHDAELTIVVYKIAEISDVPDDVTTIVADVIHNLREPLDHLASQLVLAAHGGTAPDWRVYYPITATPTDYPATRGGTIKGVRQEVIDAIDATEPYKGGKGHGLWQLNALNNFGKHNLLVAAGSVLTDITMTAGVKPHIIGMQMTLKPPIVPLIKGDEIFRSVKVPEMNDHVSFAFDVSFNHPSVVECEPVLKTLQDMANLVDDVIVRLGRFLP